MSKYRYVFGPVPSRRLGMSLGIDVVPYKVCSLDCVYCEVGATTDLTVERKEYFPVDIILKELKDYLDNNTHPDFITFSGSGEPALNIGIGKIISFIKKEYKDIPIAFLTNGTILCNKEIRKEILEADIILPSLDAGNYEMFKKINRPCEDIDFDKYIDGLVELRKEYKGKYWLEVFILPGYNDTQEELLDLKNIIQKIKPDSIQLNTLDRPGVLTDIVPASREFLQHVIDIWEFENIEIIARNTNNPVNNSFDEDIEDKILSTISRRPCTVQDLEKILGVHKNEINKYLSILENNGKIKREKLERGIFYSKIL